MWVMWGWVGIKSSSFQQPFFWSGALFKMHKSEIRLRLGLHGSRCCISEPASPLCLPSFYLKIIFHTDPALGQPHR